LLLSVWLKLALIVSISNTVYDFLDLLISKKNYFHILPFFFQQVREARRRREERIASKKEEALQTFLKEEAANQASKK
jgi:hypothetical protein